MDQNSDNNSNPDQPGNEHAFYNKSTLAALRERIRYLEDENDELEQRLSSVIIQKDLEHRKVQESYALKYEELQQENAQLVVDYEKQIAVLMKKASQDPLADGLDLQELNRNS